MKNINIMVDEKYRYIYEKVWKDRDCISQTHRIWFFKNYGVIGICEMCNTIQGFNLLH